MRRSALLIVSFAIVALLAVGCGGGMPTGAIATVGSGVITKADFDLLVNRAKAEAKMTKQPFPALGSYAYDQYAAQAIDYLVGEKVVDQQATSWHIKITAAQVSDRIASLEKAYKTTAAFDAALKEQGLTRAVLPTLIRDQLTSAAVYSRVTAGVKVSDAQALAYYNAHKSTFSQPEKRHLRQILVKTKAQAEKVRALLLGGASWKAVAAKYSIDSATKKLGGDLGEVTPGEMVAAFNKAAFSLPADTISQPVKSPYGWHIIEVLSITKAKVETFTQEKAAVIQQLTSTKGQELAHNWLTKAEQAAHIRYASGYDPAVLQKTKRPTTSPSPTASPSTTP